ncbi:cysteine desulfurase [Candidatus Saccharibacteria bacterium]|nr:cysteine desulfurase [Candidatus Saccharibacteria bacterium]
MFYLDHAAATPVSDKALAAMTPYFAADFFNPSAPYLPAVEVRKIYEAAKDDIASRFGGKGTDLIITAGATESINLAFTAVTSTDSNAVLISAVEHPSVIANAKKFPKFGTIKVDQYGQIILSDLAAKITPRTQLISVCLASSELGTLQPISEIAQLIRTERQRRLQAGDKTPIYLHCDASQGVGLVDIKVSRLGVDLLTINSGKIYGPKGIGALWHAHQVKLRPIVVGGGQEMGLRSGTENVPAVIGFAAAIKEADRHLASERKRLQKLRDLLRRELSNNPSIKFLGHPKCQLVNFLPISIPGLDAERLIFKLEQHEVYVSTGAACAARKGVKSPALSAIGLSTEQITGSLRLTLGKLNDEKTIKQVAKIILDVIVAEQERIK